MNWRDGGVGAVWLGVALGALFCKAAGLLWWLPWKIALIPLAALFVVVAGILVGVAFTTDDVDRGM